MHKGGGRALGNAWVFLCVALGAHVADEALTGFLSVYNPTVLNLKLRYPWFVAPVFSFDVWLWGLIAAVAVLLGMSYFAYRGARFMLPASFVFGGLMAGNSMLHTVATIMGRTVAEVHFPRPMPGFYSSPLLLVASVYLIIEAVRAARSEHSVRTAAA